MIVVFELGSANVGVKLENVGSLAVNPLLVFEITVLESILSEVIAPSLIVLVVTLPVPSDHVFTFVCSCAITLFFL